MKKVMKKAVKKKVKTPVNTEVKEDIKPDPVMNPGAEKEDRDAMPKATFIVVYTLIALLVVCGIALIYISISSLKQAENDVCVYK